MIFLSLNRWSRTLAVYILASLITSSTLISQENTPPDTPLPTGSQLKVITAKDNKRKKIIGTVVNWKSDSVELTGKDQVARSISIDDIQKIYVRTGSKRHWKRGFIIGAAIGSTIWLINPVGDKNDRWRDFDIRMNTIGTINATVLGTLIGGLIKTTKWKETVMRSTD